MKIQCPKGCNSDLEIQDIKVNENEASMEMQCPLCFEEYTYKEVYDPELLKVSKRYLLNSKQEEVDY